MGGNKAAWYQLRVHARPFPGNLCVIVNGQLGKISMYMLQPNC